MLKTITMILLTVTLLTVLPVSAQASCRGPFCGGIQQRMESWLGHHYRELIASWGVPQLILPDGAGGSMIVYQETAGGGRIWWKRVRTFFVDSNGIIISFQWRGF